jgi:hypothetical protein
VNTGTKALHDAAAAHARDKKVTFDAALAAVRGPALAAPLGEVAKADGIRRPDRRTGRGRGVVGAGDLHPPGTGAEPRVPLSAADVKRFGELVGLDKAAAREQVPRGADGPGDQDRRGEGGGWGPEGVHPGRVEGRAEIVRAAFAEGRLGDKKVVFFQKGQHAWIAGYLMEAAKLPD